MALRLSEPAVGLFWLVFLALLVLLPYFRLRLWLLRNLRRAESRLTRIETELSNYLTFGRYMKRRERVHYANYLRSILGSILAVRPFKRVLGKEDQGRADEAKAEPAS